MNKKFLTNFRKTVSHPGHLACRHRQYLFFFPGTRIKEIPLKIRMVSRQKAANGLENGRIHDFFMEATFAASPQKQLLEDEH